MTLSSLYTLHTIRGLQKKQMYLVVILIQSWYDRQATLLPLPPLTFLWQLLIHVSGLFFVHRAKKMDFCIISQCNILGFIYTMLQKLLKCEVKAASLCWKIILPPLRFYMKSNFGKFKPSSNINFGNFKGSEYLYW